MENTDVRTKNRKKLKNNRNKKKSFQNLATRRIDELFDQAEKLFHISPKYSNNCVILARKISLKHKVSFSLEQKMKYCKKCNFYLKPGISSKVRVSRGKIIVRCNNCKNISRYCYK